MKQLFLTLMLLASAAAQAQVSFPFLGKTIVLEDSLGAALANRRSDAYTAGLTPFDLAIRLQTDAAPSEQDYLDRAATSMRNWQPGATAELKRSLAALEGTALALNLRIPMPDTIILCNTTAREEFGAEGYTRHNRIMLNGANGDLSPALLAHELWHVISRLNPGLRDRAYANFGFRPCNRIAYKPAFDGRVISNPDCPVLEHYMRIRKDGRDVDVTLVLYAGSPYVKGRGLMDYAAIGLLALEGDDAHKHPVMRDGRPVIFELRDTEDFYRQAGRNSEYMLHVEELTAEHFAALMTGRPMKQMELVQKLKTVLQ